MAMLDSYIDQISSSAQSISELQFPAPKIFTNAQLGDHEITSLIRDTEPHEHALFTLNPALAQKNSHRSNDKNEKETIYNVRGHGLRGLLADTVPAKQSAVARVLGNELLHAIRQSSGPGAKSKTDVDVEVLLAGVEKLSEAYTVPGVSEKVAAIRHRYQQTAASLRTYESRVKQQQSKLNRLNTGSLVDVDSMATGENGTENQAVALTEEDLEHEEAEIRELEARKKTLENRVNGMEKDLGDLLR